VLLPRPRPRPPPRSSEYGSEPPLHIIISDTQNSHDMPEFLNTVTVDWVSVEPATSLLRVRYSTNKSSTPIKTHELSVPRTDSQTTAIELFQSPLDGSGTVFHRISHLLRYFPSSALTWTHTSSNSVTRNYCCRAREVTVIYGHINRSYLLTLCAATREATRPKRVETDASAMLLSLTLASCDLDLWPPGLQSWIISCPCPVDHLCQFVSQSVHSLSKYHVQNFRNKQTTRQTNM